MGCGGSKEVRPPPGVVGAPSETLYDPYRGFHFQDNLSSIDCNADDTAAKSKTASSKTIFTKEKFQLPCVSTITIHFKVHSCGTGRSAIFGVGILGAQASGHHERFLGETELSNSVGFMNHEGCSKIIANDKTQEKFSFLIADGDVITLKVSGSRLTFQRNGIDVPCSLSHMRLTGEFRFGASLCEPGQRVEIVKTLSVATTAQPTATAAAISAAMLEFAVPNSQRSPAAPTPNTTTVTPIVTPAAQPVARVTDYTFQGSVPSVTLINDGRTAVGNKATNATIITNQTFTVPTKGTAFAIAYKLLGRGQADSTIGFGVVGSAATEHTQRFLGESEMSNSVGLVHYDGDVKVIKADRAIGHVPFTIDASDTIIVKVEGSSIYFYRNGVPVSCDLSTVVLANGTYRFGASICDKEQIVEIVPLASASLLPSSAFHFLDELKSIDCNQTKTVALSKQTRNATVVTTETFYLPAKERSVTASFRILSRGTTKSVLGIGVLAARPETNGVRFVGEKELPGSVGFLNLESNVQLISNDKVIQGFDFSFAVGDLITLRIEAATLILFRNGTLVPCTTPATLTSGEYCFGVSLCEEAQCVEIVSSAPVPQFQFKDDVATIKCNADDTVAVCATTTDATLVTRQAFYLPTRFPLVASFKILSVGSAQSTIGFGLVGKAAAEHESRFLGETELSNSIGFMNYGGCAKVISKDKAEERFSFALARGDVITLQVQGSTLSLFRNGAPVACDLSRLKLTGEFRFGASLCEKDQSVAMVFPSSLSTWTIVDGFHFYDVVQSIDCSDNDTHAICVKSTNATIHSKEVFAMPAPDTIIARFKIVQRGPPGSIMGFGVLSQLGGEFPIRFLGEVEIPCSIGLVEHEGKIKVIHGDKARDTFSDIHFCDGDIISVSISDTKVQFFRNGCLLSSDGLNALVSEGEFRVGVSLCAQGQHVRIVQPGEFTGPDTLFNPNEGFHFFDNLLSIDCNDDNTRAESTKAEVQATVVTQEVFTIPTASPVATTFKILKRGPPGSIMGFGLVDSNARCHSGHFVGESEMDDSIGFVYYNGGVKVIANDTAHEQIFADFEEGDEITLRIDGSNVALTRNGAAVACSVFSQGTLKPTGLFRLGASLCDEGQEVRLEKASSSLTTSQSVVKKSGKIINEASLHIEPKKTEATPVVEPSPTKQTADGAKNFSSPNTTTGKESTMTQAFNPDSLVEHKRVELAEVKFSAKDKIGSGQYGTVFRGTHGGKPVAIKAIRVTDLDDDTDGLQLLKEVLFGSVLSHPNLLCVTNWAENIDAFDVKSYLLVMPLVVPGNLGKVLSTRALQSQWSPATGGPLGWHHFFKVAVGVANGLGYLASRSPPIVHRDLKPENILVDEDYCPMITDFGLAKRSDSRRSTRLAVSASGVVGTPLYMSPEALSQRSTTSATDVYSFGCILWELLHGKPPRGHCKSMSQLEEEVVEDQTPLASDAKVPKTIAALITKATSFEVSRRPLPKELRSTLERECEMFTVQGDNYGKA